MLGTRAEVLTVAVGAAGTAPRLITMPTDQRRHRRFPASAVAAQAAVIESRDRRLHLTGCTLTNLGYGGMCFTADEPIVPGADYRFLIKLAAPFDDLLLVKARITWTGRDREGRPQAGAKFVESSKGWLGPDDD